VFEKLKKIERRTNIEGVILESAKESIFIAGADINEIKGVMNRSDTLRASKTGHEIFGRIESLPFPVVAAINGVFLGGGTELALACHGRVGPTIRGFKSAYRRSISPSCPLRGGTTRAAWLVGLQRGLELILTGCGIDAEKAKRIGLNDRARSTSAGSRTGARIGG
jgi:3-hydroxyacyl-CoA dehydrogenase/enoyl-CoA hydratase/3-hydroxybutyryl-CoA epimerase